MSRSACTISRARVHHLGLIDGTSAASSAHEARSSKKGGR
jgi:hypothetical protein